MVSPTTEQLLNDVTIKKKLQQVCVISVRVSRVHNFTINERYGHVSFSRSMDPVHDSIHCLYFDQVHHAFSDRCSFARCLSFPNEKMDVLFDPQNIYYWPLMCKYDIFVHEFQISLLFDPVAQPRIFHKTHASKLAKLCNDISMP